MRERGLEQEIRWERGGCLGSERVGLPAAPVRVLAFILSEKVELERSLERSGLTYTVVVTCLTHLNCEPSENTRYVLFTSM